MKEVRVRFVGSFGVSTSKGDMYAGDVKSLPVAEAQQLLRRGKVVLVADEVLPPEPTVMTRVLVTEFQSAPARERRGKR